MKKKSQKGGPTTYPIHSTHFCSNCEDYGFCVLAFDKVKQACIFYARKV
jgi:hypothetical protein